MNELEQRLKNTGLKVINFCSSDNTMGKVISELVMKKYEINVYTEIIGAINCNTLEQIISIISSTDDNILCTVTSDSSNCNDEISIMKKDGLISVEAPFMSIVEYIRSLGNVSNSSNIVFTTNDDTYNLEYFEYDKRDRMFYEHTLLQCKQIIEILDEIIDKKPDDCKSIDDKIKYLKKEVNKHLEYDWGGFFKEKIGGFCKSHKTVNTESFVKMRTLIALTRKNRKGKRKGSLFCIC